MHRVCRVHKNKISIIKLCKMLPLIFEWICRMDEEFVHMYFLIFQSEYQLLKLTKIVEQIVEHYFST